MTFLTGCERHRQMQAVIGGCDETKFIRIFLKSQHQVNFGNPYILKTSCVTSFRLYGINVACCISG